MSWRKAFSKRAPKRPRNFRQILMSMSSEDDDNMPLSSLLRLKSPARPKKTKKSAPKRVRRPQLMSSLSSTPAAAASPVEVVDLMINKPDLLFQTPEKSMMIDTVNSKMGSFLQSAGLISSDEDETDMMKAKSKKKFPVPLFISDDSDDDCKMVGQAIRSFDLSKPSTSTGISSDTLKDNKPHGVDDILELVDSVLEEKDTNSCEPKQSPLKDMKSLEDFRKETEKMLNEANSLLDEFKTGRKPEVEEKKEESPKVTIGSCPICLESLAARPASVTVCGHIFCKECISQTVKTLKKCPTCRKPLTIKKIHPIYF